MKLTFRFPLRWLPLKPCLPAVLAVTATLLCIRFAVSSTQEAWRQFSPQAPQASQAQ